MYDYGFRDYSPVSARFTTVDPIRDGSNWFSYVVNDPVNYVDLLGLNPVSDLIDGAKELYEEAKKLPVKAKDTINDFIKRDDVQKFIYGEQVTKTINGQEITVKKSSPLLKTAAGIKYYASKAMIMSGTPSLVTGGLILSQLPTGRVDNQTGNYLAFAGEHSELGQAYLTPGVTYVFGDFATTRGEESGFTVKTNPISDMTITQSEVTFSFETQLINSTVNGVKSFLRDTDTGRNLNAAGGFIDQFFGQTLTTEPYNTYKNSDLLSPANDFAAPKLSGNIIQFKNENPSYFTESHNSTNVFNGSSNVYIGFNGGCTK